MEDMRSPKGPLRPRVMVLVYQYPQLSETYIIHELNVLSQNYEFKVIADKDTDTFSDEGLPCKPPTRKFRKLQLTWECMRFRPDILHGHWLQPLPQIVQLSRKFSIPFTLRTHSSDILKLRNRSGDPQIRQKLSSLNDELCLGVLSFPFSRPILEAIGVKPEKIIDCYPVVNVDRYRDTSPNDAGIMNLGCVLPKKNYEDYLKLAELAPDLEFDLYLAGYGYEDLEKLSERRGGRVRVHHPVPNRQMPALYKKHEWLVYTACRKLGTVGWPMAVAEAQASGVGVVFPNLRPDLSEYVGDAGYLYDSIEDVARIIRHPFPEDKREIGFKLAERSNFTDHQHLLTGLWNKSVGISVQPADRLNQ